jgi:phytoene dehydrogenase-like protein
MSDYDVMIIGANTPALVAAAYLGKLAGLKVLILEKSNFIGATAQTREMVPGFKFHPAATGEYYVHPQIENELELKHFGLERIPASPKLTTSFGDGKYLSLYDDIDASCEEIGRFSKHDAAAYRPFIEKWGKIGYFFGMANMNAPVPFSQLAGSMSVNKEMEGLMRDMFFCTIRDVLDREFENDYVKAAFLTLMEGSTAGPSGSPFFQGVGRILSPWGFVKGGLVKVAEALTKAAEKYGAVIKKNSNVVKILVKNGQAYAVKLESGEEITANKIISELEPANTFLNLVGEQDTPPDFIQDMKSITYEGSGVTFNLALSGMPDFGFPEDRYGGFFGISTPGYDYMEKAFPPFHMDDIPERMGSMTYLPSYFDEGYAPKGQHTLTGYIFPVPYHLRKGNWETRKEELFDKWIDSLADFSPNIRQLVIGRGGYSPAELEKMFSMTHADIQHGSFRWIHQMGFRPMPGWSNYRTPIKNLYMAGVGTHPTNGLGGTNGFIVARAVIDDLKAKK